MLVSVGRRMSMLKGRVTTSLQFIRSKPKPYWNKSHASAFCCGAPGSPGHVQVVVWWADCSAQVFLLLALKEGGGLMIRRLVDTKGNQTIPMTTSLLPKQ